MSILTDWLDSLRENLVSILAIALIVIILLGYILFLYFSILPQWQARSELASQLALAQQAANQAAQSQGSSLESLRVRVESGPQRIEEAASVFLTEGQAAETLGRLYQYAAESQVEIVDLRTQPVLQQGGDDLYEVRMYQLQVTGAIPRFVDFISRIREASLTGFVITNIDASQGPEADSLLMDIVLYTSALGSGSTSVSTLPIPTPTPPARTVTYVARTGDTLLSVAQQYGVSLVALRAVNNLPENTLTPGRELIIPR